MSARRPTTRRGHRADPRRPFPALADPVPRSDRCRDHRWLGVEHGGVRDTRPGQPIGRRPDRGMARGRCRRRHTRRSVWATATMPPPWNAFWPETLVHSTPSLDVQTNARLGVSPQSRLHCGSWRPTASQPSPVATTSVTSTVSVPTAGVGKASGRAVHASPSLEDQLAGCPPIRPTATTPPWPAASLIGYASAPMLVCRCHVTPSAESR